MYKRQAPRWPLRPILCSRQPRDLNIVVLSHGSPPHLQYNSVSHNRLLVGRANCDLWARGAAQSQSTYVLALLFQKKTFSKLDVSKQHQVLNLALDITCTVRASQSMCLHAGFGFPATLGNTCLIFFFFFPPTA